jgi:hypothetical protein
MNSEQLTGAWSAAVAGWNEGDFGPMSALMAPDCIFDHVGTSRDEIIAFLQKERADGQLRHDPVCVTASGSVLVTIARNTFADGSTSFAGGAMRFNDDGQIFYIAAVDERAEVG